MKRKQISAGTLINELRRKAQESRQEPAAPEKTVETPTQKPDHKEFWKLFWAFYCNPNKLSIADSHRHAYHMCDRHGRHTPTYRQVHSVMAKMSKEDWATVEQTRNK